MRLLLLADGGGGGGGGGRALAKFAAIPTATPAANPIGRDCGLLGSKNPKPCPRL